MLEHHDHAGRLGLVRHQARQIRIAPVGETDDFAGLALRAELQMR